MRWVRCPLWTLRPGANGRSVRSPRPGARRSSVAETASGRPQRSSRKPSRRSVTDRPPIRGAASRTVTDTPAPVRWRAAASPAGPAPTMTTSTADAVRSTCPSRGRSQRRRTPVVPGAAVGIPRRGVRGRQEGGSGHVRQGASRGASTAPLGQSFPSGTAAMPPGRRCDADDSAAGTTPQPGDRAVRAPERSGGVRGPYGYAARTASMMRGWANANPESSSRRGTIR